MPGPGGRKDLFALPPRRVSNDDKIQAVAGAYQTVTASKALESQLIWVPKVYPISKQFDGICWA